MALSVFALLSDPVDGVEVVVGAHTWNGLLQQVQQVGGATGPSSTPSIRHGVVRPYKQRQRGISEREEQLVTTAGMLV